MKPAFKQIFWGFIIVYFELNIEFVDLLADPIGYFLIFKGLKLLKDYFSACKHAITLALFLIFFSIPAIFLPNNRTDEFHSIYSLQVTDFYLFSLSFVNLLLIFFVFKLLLEISANHENLQKRIQIIFLLYMISSISTLVIQPFLWGFAVVLLIGLSIATGIVAFIMHIIFLVQIWKFQNFKDYTPKPMHKITFTSLFLMCVLIIVGGSYYLTLIKTRPTAEEFNQFIENRYGVVCLGKDCTNLEIIMNTGEEKQKILMVSSGSSGRSDIRLYRNYYFFSEDPDLNYVLKFHIIGKLGNFEVIREHFNIFNLLAVSAEEVS